MIDQTMQLVYNSSPQTLMPMPWAGGSPPAHRGARARPHVRVVRKPSLRDRGTWPSPYSVKRYWMMSSDSYICLPVQAKESGSIVNQDRLPPTTSGDRLASVLFTAPAMAVSSWSGQYQARWHKAFVAHNNGATANWSLLQQQIGRTYCFGLRCCSNN